ncbi:MAG: amidase [Methylocystis sp.]|nr:amidase [Methylocystis sp.]MCA3585382.1 amidase [Methylocystis sp.]MCA3588619.1 amidase [Methylocystis sp.]MCA3591833.1 amidase [Methylocystis sp.]
MSEISQRSARDLAASYRAKTLSPVEAVQDALSRIERFEPAVNAFTIVDAEGALAMAKASEARWAKGEPLGEADGIVTTIKSNVAARGWSARRGSAAISDAPAPEDAPVVANLRRAGCIFIGQTAMPEFGWIGVTHCRLTGITRNPWNTSRTPGGSSGGAAAAAALGIGSFHVGTDGAGSIRIPAAFSGLFGIMPSVGRVPAYPASPFGVLARLGPLTRKVDDGALMLKIMAGADARDIAHDGHSPPDYPAELTKGLRGLRLGWSATLGFVDKLHPDVLAATEKATRRLTEFGALVSDADPGFGWDAAFGPLGVLWEAGCAQVLRGIPADRHGEIDQGFLACARAGQKLSAADVLQAMSGRAALYETMRRYHERFDLLLTPQMPITALEAGIEAPRDGSFGDQWFNWSPYTWPFNVTGQPGASVPVGLASDGLPIGLQIIGPKGREDLVLRVAKGVEMLSDFPMLEGVRAG